MASGSGYNDWDDDNRRRVYEGTQILERSGQSIVRSTQYAVETDRIGNEVKLFVLVYTFVTLFLFRIFHKCLTCVTLTF